MNIPVNFALLLLMAVIPTRSFGLDVDESAAGFSFTVDDSFVRGAHPAKKIAPDIFFDLYASREQGFAIGGQAYRVQNWNVVIERAIEKVRKEMPFQFTSESVRLSDKTDSGEPVSIYWARTDNPKVPVFMFYSFKTAPHAWIVYFVSGRSIEPADYLTFAKKIYKTVRVKSDSR